MWSWILAYRNLGRNKRRSLATGLAICAGFTGMVLVAAYLYPSQQALQTSTIYLNHKGHLALFKKGSLSEFTYRPSRYIITKEEQDKITSILKDVESDIEFTGRYLTGTGLVNSHTKSTPFLATAIEPRVYKRILTHPKVLYWNPEWVFEETTKSIDRLMENPHVLSITEPMGLNIGKQPPYDAYSAEDKTVQLIALNYYGDLNVVDAELGLRHTTGMALAEDTSLNLSLSQLQSLYSTDGIEYWALYLKDLSSMSRVQETLKRKLKEQNLEIEVLPFDDDEWGIYYVGSIGFLVVIGCFFVVLICGAVILSVVNTTTLGIFERYREIGTLRATGFPPSAIHSLFWKENFILSLIAIVIGYALSEWIAVTVNAAKIMFRPPGTQSNIYFFLEDNPKITVTLAIIVILVNFISTIAAVRRSTRASIVNLLAAPGG